jgi:hypothetical protein
MKTNKTYLAGMMNNNQSKINKLENKVNQLNNELMIARDNQRGIVGKIEKILEGGTSARVQDQTCDENGGADGGETLNSMLTKVTENNYDVFKELLQRIEENKRDIEDLDATIGLLISKFENIKEIAGQLPESGGSHRVETPKVEVNIEPNLDFSNLEKKIGNNKLTAAEIANIIGLTDYNAQPYGELITILIIYYDNNFCLTVKPDHRLVSEGQNVPFYYPFTIKDVLEWFKHNIETLYYERYYQRPTQYNDAGDLIEYGFKVGEQNYRCWHARLGEKA